MNNDGGNINPGSVAEPVINNDPGNVVASAQQQVSVGQPPVGQSMDQPAFSVVQADDNLGLSSSVVENVSVPGQQAAQATSEPEQTPADVLVSEVSAALTKYQAAKSK